VCLASELFLMTSVCNIFRPYFTIFVRVRLLRFTRCFRVGMWEWRHRVGFGAIPFLNRSVSVACFVFDFSLLVRQWDSRLNGEIGLLGCRDFMSTLDGWPAYEIYVSNGLVILIHCYYYIQDFLMASCLPCVQISTPSAYQARMVPQSA
jgi:hypothetical protein